MTDVCEMQPIIHEISVKTESDFNKEVTNVKSENFDQITNECSEDQIEKGDINLKEELADLSFETEHAFIKLSSYSMKELRSIKTQIEETLLNKIKNIERDEANQNQDKRYVCYFKKFSIDKVGNSVGLGETGIAEGWNIPMYENEFRNLLGLPFTEDTASIRIKKPRQECFNCLSTNHGVRECPVKMNQDRIEFHKKIFTTQSQQAQDQAQLFSNRYTSDLDTKANRGFVPGKLSDQLKEALGVKPNQLPPFIYIMRQYGYPIGWLLEAQVTNTKLAVHGGGDMKSENGEITEESQIEYDSDKIFSFPGFNEPPERGTIDESEFYRVKRYGSEFSKEKFLSTLKLEKKVKVVTRNISKVDEPNGETKLIEKDTNDSIESLEGNDLESNPSNSLDGSTKQVEEEDEELEEGEEINKSNETDEFSSNKKLKLTPKSKTKNEKHGTSFTEIPGTPIVNNSMGGIDKVPAWEKFSENICAHKPFEMNPQTPTGSYQNIVKLTKKFKSNSNLEISKDF